MRCLLIGNFGVGNLGDEALREYFLNTFPETTWMVVSINVPRLPCGFRSFFITSWWRTVREYWHADKVVFGGGSLFTDTESVRAPMLWWWHACVAWLLQKPILLAFQGVGPFRTTLGECVSRWVVQHAVFVSVRDPKSFERVKQWRTDVVLGCDPIFKVVHEFSLPRRGIVPKERGLEKIFAVIPRWNSDNGFLNRAQEFYVQGSFSNIRILSLQPSNIEEQKICKKIERAFPKCTRVLVHGYGELVAEIHRASFVLSERFHGALAALALGIPFETVSQATDDKLMALKTVSKEEALTLVEKGEKALRYALNI